MQLVSLVVLKNQVITDNKMADHSSRNLTRIFLWCVPRSCSTAFTKMMSFVDGAEVWFEPYTKSFFQKFSQNPSSDYIKEGAADFIERAKARSDTSSATDLINHRPGSTFTYVVLLLLHFQVKD